jgi:pimeloyl-ACP methyl ester carboxylesterase
MPKLQRNGVEIYFDTHGPSTSVGDGDAPVILLTHGFSATSRMWRGQIEALAKTHKLVLWDMRGHGQSSYPTDPTLYSEAHTVADMAAILDAVGAERAIIGGLSLGGYMSLAFHLAYPKRVQALLIIDCGPGFRNDAARAQWNDRAERRAQDFETRGLTALTGRSNELDPSAHRSIDGLIKAARGMLTQRDSRIIDSLPSIKVPAIVIVGAKDEPFLNASDYMAAKIPGARKVVIPEAGHAANIDQPNAFNRAVVDFLAQLH